MFPTNPAVVGVVLLSLGILIWVGLRLGLRLAPRIRPAPEPAEGEVLASHIQGHQDAVLVVQSGGRVVALNEQGRLVFGLQLEELPNLQRMLRRVRPEETLLSLCAREGKARFVINGRLVEAASHWLPVQPIPLMAISLRPTTALAEQESEAGDLPSQTVRSIHELSLAVASDMDLNATISAILETVDKLVPADFLEITLWEEARAWFIPYRVIGLSAPERSLEAVHQRYSDLEGFSGWIMRERVPLLLEDVLQRPDIHQDEAKAAFPLRAYLGMPLVAGGEFVGTLELGSIHVATFGEKDLETLNLLSSQAAIAIHNARLQQGEKQHAAELSGLAQLTQAFSSVRDSKGLYGLLVQAIVPLVQVEIIGFLIYNESQHYLEGQSPFYGLPQPFMEMYRLPVPPGSAVEKTLLAQEVLITDNAMQDARWKSLGLDALAVAASLRDTMLLPLVAAGHMLGYLQASNHPEGVPGGFSQAEIHLLMIIANQAAPVVENTSLVLQTRQRAQRAETLRRITRLVSSSAPLAEILTYSLQELGQLTRAESGALFLVDENGASLSLHRPSQYGIQVDIPERAATLLTEDAEFPFTVTGGQRAINSGRVSETGAVIPFYKTLLGYWKCESVVIVPLMARDRGIGELWLGSPSPDFFEEGDLRVAVTAAGQLASLVEQSLLSEQTDEGLRKQVEQLSSLTRISRDLNASLDPNYLLRQVYEEAVRSTHADCGAILILEANPNGNGTDLTRLYTVGDTSQGSLSTLETRVLQTGESLLVSELKDEEFSTRHAQLASALWVPIPFQGQQRGLIVMHASTAHRFDSSAVNLVQSLAAQAALALSNALQYEEQRILSEKLKRQVETQRKLAEVSTQLRAGQSLEAALPGIADAVREGTSFQVVVISLWDAQTSRLQRAYGLGLAPEQWQNLCENVPTWGAIQQLLQPEFKIGGVYFIPAERMPQAPQNVHFVTVLPAKVSQDRDGWDADDVLLAPLYDSSGSPLGLISLDAPSDHKRPQSQALESLALIAAQVCLVIEKQIQMDNLQTRMAKIDSEFTRMVQAEDAASQQLPLLLQQSLENNQTIQQLSQHMERAGAWQKLSEMAARQTDIPSILNIVARELLSRYNLQLALIAEKTAAGPRMVEVVGSLPENTYPESYFGQRNPLGHLLDEPEVLLVQDLSGDEEWRQNSLLTALHATSFIGVALAMGKGRVYAVLGVGQKQLPHFEPDDHQAISQVARQVEVSLQNLYLLDETRLRLQEVDLLLSFSRKLGSLNPTSILNALVESVLQAIPAAQAGWVALWDAKEAFLVPQVAAGYADSASLLGVHFMAPENPDLAVPLPVRVFLKGQALRVAEIHFGEDYVLLSQDLVRYRKASGSRLPVACMLVPLRLGDNSLGVLVLDNFNLTDAFTQEDEYLTQTLAQQTALALENARLYVSSEQRAAQLQALTQVAGTISSSLQSEDLISSLLDQLKQVLPFTTATLWLRHFNRLSAVAASGFAEGESPIGNKVEVDGNSLFQELAASGQPLSVGDVRRDRRFPSIMEPDKYSWLGVPLMAKSQMTGAIVLEKTEARFYSEEHIQAATTFASQAAVALENARLFEESLRRAAELDQRSQRLALLNTFSRELATTLDVDYILRLTAQQLLSALNGSRVAAVMVDERSRFILQTEVPAWVNDLPQPLPAIPLLDRLKLTLGSYNVSDVKAEADLAHLMDSYFTPYNIHSLLIVPLVSGNNLHGWFWVQTTHFYSFTTSEMELARTLSNQSAIAIQNARQFAETRRLKDELELRVEERTIEVRREHQNTETLLSIITELSASLDMDQVLERTLGVLNQSAAAEESLIILADTGSPYYRAGEALVAAGIAGRLIDGHPEREISQWVIRRNQSALVENALTDSRWRFPANLDIRYRSVIAVPLVLGEDVLGALLLFNRNEAFFIQEQVALVEATARQIAIALNNAHLFNLIRSQSERMGVMLREQQIESSRSRAILESVADGVLVTDAANQITLFNRSAEAILGLKSEEVIGKEFDQAAGNLGKEARAWFQTIYRWMENPHAFSDGETYSEQIDLVDGKVVAVHLSAVFWGSELLGTVSIIRDITSEVQVDRLKSEFLANVSHELRTPMTSIKGYAEIMLMGASGALTPQQTHFLEVIKSNVVRLNTLVNDLLDISRVESGKVMLSLEEIRLEEIAQNVIAHFLNRSRDENKPMSFDIEASPDLPAVEGDAERLRQLLINLVGNSYNYTLAGGSITIDLKRCEEGIQVDVTDTGIGIPLPSQKRIFERFYRGDDPLVLASAGTGLGLSMAKTLVEMHHGRIWFTSSGVPGEGSVFSFLLPLIQPEE